MRTSINPYARIVGIRQRKPCKILYYEVYFGNTLIDYTTDKSKWKGQNVTFKIVK